MRCLYLSSLWVYDSQARIMLSKSVEKFYNNFITIIYDGMKYFDTYQGVIIESA